MSLPQHNPLRLSVSVFSSFIFVKIWLNKYMFASLNVALHLSLKLCWKYMLQEWFEMFSWVF